MRRHLEADGRLIFDISKWDLAVLARDPGERRPVLRWMDPERGEVKVEETARYDAAEQIRYIRWHFPATDTADFRRIDYRLRVIFPQELVVLLESAGFRIEARFEEFTRESFQASSPRQLCVCVARG